MRDQILNIYCDETRVENTNSQFMVIGALVLPRSHKERLIRAIKDLKLKHNFYQEIKWNKVGSKYANFYQELIRLFARNGALSCRAVIIDKTQVQLDAYHNNDEELAFFKFYYLLLRELLGNNCYYYIFLDKKPTRDKNRARALKAFLDSHVLYHRESSQIKHLQAYDSEDNVLIQMADFLTGLIGYANNSESSGYKVELVKHFQETNNVNLCQTTSRTQKKLNLLKWIPFEA